ncbi:MAG TPA: glycosyltransferase family 1 protein [bacterium]|nr:glycosyltransferase family 1 protein [bacterium]HPN44263.1 glycosyltransferase family 1 protein [bacterium]
MKLAIFTESLPPNTDGVVKTLSRLADSLLDEHIDFKFFSPVKPESGYAWADRVKKVGSVPLFLYKDYKLSLPYFSGIDVDLDAMRPDLVHICTPSLLGLFGMDYARKNSIPIVSSYHTNFVDYFSYFGLDGLEASGWNYLKWFHNRCERTYVPSPSVISELQQKGIRDMELWQRGIELERFNPAKRSRQLRESIGADAKPVLLFVGRLINHKDLEDLVEAHTILENRYDYKLVIVGDGPMKAELIEKLPEAHFTGYQYGEDLARWYASADIFVFPSTTETFGNVILEAFASGLPAIGVAKGGVADIINHGVDGYIAEPKNPADFAAKIALLLDNPDYRVLMGVQARVTAKNYCWNTINGKLIKSYERVIENYYNKKYHLAS